MFSSKMRSMIPRVLALVLLLVAGVVPLARAQLVKPNSVQFEQFVADLWKDAQAQGHHAGDLRQGLRRRHARSARDRHHQEAAGVQQARRRSTSIRSPRPATPAEGRKKEAQWRPTFDAIEKKYQVERWVILAIWGMETSYGALKDKWDGIRSLATLAFAKYRDPYFRNELLVALKIIQDGHIAREKFASSWAGAMGQTQFMPTNFVDYAVDFNGDGKRDIWTNVPDVLASTANYFAKAAGGWKMGVPWGFEVIVPQGFDLMKSRATFDEWTQARRQARRRQGVSGDRRRHPVFSGRRCPGPAFIVTPNFEVIKDYNDSDVYALAIGHLSDLMQGGGPFKTPWPAQATQLPRDDRIALQKKLAALGYDQTRFSAHIDFKMRDFVRAEQKKHGLVTDGHPNAALMEKMGVKRYRCPVDVTGGVLGFEPGHVENIAQRVEPMLAGQRWQARRSARRHNSPPPPDPPGRSARLRLEAPASSFIDVHIGRPPPPGRPRHYIHCEYIFNKSL